ncbi:helix-turn-helix domain-containing protein [Kitasatospora saccharophila]|uniref:Helix-turn-helix domain-containing protein n=1 Tax=Kitasatospora saccharophila TaxID=407973 RepID=A0ABN2WJS8_9ACTN
MPTDLLNLRQPIGTEADSDQSAGSAQITRNGDEDFRGTLARRAFGAVRVSYAAGGPHELIRPHRAAETAETGWLRLVRPLSGELWVFQDGRHVAVRSPQLVCFDSTRPYKVITLERFSLVQALLPHSLVGLTPRDAASLTARSWDGGQGLAALTADLLAGVGRHWPDIDTAEDLLGNSIVGLAAALFSERLRATAAADTQVAKQALMLRVQAFVREQLADPDLSPALLAERYHVSLRYLQKTFQDHGTSPARWIRDERLARCRAELADPARDHLPVAVIGERNGLYGASHFSRLFRNRYGITPRDFRKRRKAGPSAGAGTPFVPSTEKVTR